MLSTWRGSLRAQCALCVCHSLRTEAQKSECGTKSSYTACAVRCGAVRCAVCGAVRCRQTWKHTRRRAWGAEAEAEAEAEADALNQVEAEVSIQVATGGYPHRQAPTTVRSLSCSSSGEQPNARDHHSEDDGSAPPPLSSRRPQSTERTERGALMADADAAASAPGLRRQLQVGRLVAVHG